MTCLTGTLLVVISSYVEILTLVLLLADIILLNAFLNTGRFGVIIVRKNNPPLLVSE